MNKTVTTTDEIKNKITKTTTIKTNECEHNIIQDWIDIDPDRSMTVFYCEHCLQTFDRMIKPKK